MKKIMFNDRYGLTKAVLNGSKTMTRRIVSEGIIRMAKRDCNICGGELIERIKEHTLFCYLDTVAISQSYKTIHEEMMSGDNYGESRYDAFRNAMVAETKGWNNKMFVSSNLMPYRIQITEIKVERLQDISDEDCLREGVIRRDDLINCRMEDIVRYTFENSFVGGIWKSYPTPREAFAALIDRISSMGTWERNPWVFAYSFKLIK